jgi:hypothetical protein
MSKNDAGRRLMDLLAGWGNYADTCTPRSPVRELDRIYDLYHDAGDLVLGGTGKASEDDIRIFMYNRIIPLVLYGPGKKTTKPKKRNAKKVVKKATKKHLLQSIGD